MPLLTELFRECHRLRKHIRELQAEIDRGPRVLKARQETLETERQEHKDHHEAINGSRRKRIAKGSGTSVPEVNSLLRQYAQMRKMFKSMGKPSFARRLAGMKMPGM